MALRWRWGKHTATWTLWEDDADEGFELHFHEKPVGLRFAKLENAVQVAEWLEENFEDAMAMADGIEGWKVTDPRGQPVPTSIAADLKTPPPGAVEGAEIHGQEGDLLLALRRFAREFWDRGDDIDMLAEVGLVCRTGVGTDDEDFEITDLGRLAGLR